MEYGPFAIGNTEVTWALCSGENAFMLGKVSDHISQEKGVSL